MPRPSKLIHSVAVLRSFLGLVQKQFADLVGCSVGTIQSIELNRLQLSPKLAARISQLTGVSMEWLLEGSGKRPIPAADSRGYCFVEYTRRHFDLAQSQKLNSLSSQDVDFLLALGSADLMAVFRSASKLGPESARICYHRISKGLDKLKSDLESEFGTDLDYMKETLAKIQRDFLGGPPPGWTPPTFTPLSEEDLEKADSVMNEDEGDEVDEGAQ